MNATELREKTEAELLHLERERRDDLMHFRMQMATGIVDDVRGTREARRDIARIKTILGERSRAPQSETAEEGH